MKNKRKTVPERIAELQKVLKTLPKHMRFRREQLKAELKSLERWQERGER